MPRGFFRNPSLRMRLLAIALVAVLPIAVVSLAILARNAQSQRVELERSAMETVRALSTAVDNEMNASRSALEILATSLALAENDLQAFYGRARTALQRRPEWDNITLLDASGQQLVNLRRPFGSPLPRAGDTETFNEVLRTGKPVVSNMVPAPLTTGKRFVVRVPVFQEGRIVYVLNASTKPHVMPEMLAQQRFPAGAVVAIVDSKGLVIARSRANEESYGRPASDTLRAFIAGRPEGFGITTTLEGSEVYTAFVRSPSTRWTVAMGVPRAAIESPIVALYALLAAVIVLSLAAGIVGALLVARTVTRPMAWLGDVARGWRRGQVPEVPPIAIRELRAAAEALLAAQAERERLLQSEREARAIAEEGSRSKDEFLAMLGHELRNPLAAISSAVAVIEKSGGASHPAALAATGIIQRQSRHLARLLDDLLDVGRVMTGKILLDRTPVDFAAIVRRAVDSLIATRAGCQQIALDLTPVWVNADQSRIEQIVTNLLTNACKYTPADGLIKVTVSSHGGHAVLCVRDTGLGLEPELLPRVFELFVQGRRTLDRADGGLGIGLTLVRRLVELHGGSVAARSEGPGKGSEFEVRLPAIAPQQQAAEALGAPAASIARAVLVVEDNTDAREMLRTLLTLAGHRVHEAADGPAGVRLALEVKPDIALVDIGLPGFDGYEVASRIRAELDGAIRLVALTGYGLPEDEQRAKDAGFDQHVVKPVDETTLRRLLG